MKESDYTSAMTPVNTESEMKVLVKPSTPSAAHSLESAFSKKGKKRKSQRVPVGGKGEEEDVPIPTVE
jgi:hypothetical protein